MLFQILVPTMDCIYDITMECIYYMSPKGEYKYAFLINVSKYYKEPGALLVNQCIFLNL